MKRYSTKQPTNQMSVSALVAKTVEEAQEFVEAGFDSVATFEDVMRFRKRR